NAAHEAWQEEFRAIRFNRDWQEMARLGDVALRIAAASGMRQQSESDARRAHLGALFRARAVTSLDGLLRATEAFATLGDRDVVDEGLRVAESTAARLGDEGARDRVVAARIRLLGTASMTDVVGPSRMTPWEEGP